MATENPYVTVSAANKMEKYAINGGLSVGQALALFFRCEATQVASRTAGQTVRLNTANITDMNTQLPRNEDSFISIYPAAVATGGVKGAC